LTTVPATLVRVCSPSLLSFDELARAAHEATVRYGVTAVDNAPQRLRAILEGDAPILLSRLERGFRARLRAARLPLPITNRPAGARDALRRYTWRDIFEEPDQMLAELDDLLA
jgi:hypothetical protein